MTGFSTPPPSHPATFTTKGVKGQPSVADVIRAMAELLPPELVLFDPYAGEGKVLEAIGFLLDRQVDGIDIELWPERRPWVRHASAADERSYPSVPFAVVTSPPYVNGISADYKDGPTPSTNTAGRASYGISLGGPLDQGNLARLVVGGYQRQPDRDYAPFYDELGRHMKHWPAHAIVNVDEPMAEHVCSRLEALGYSTLVVEVATPRRRVGSHGDRRPAVEVVIGAAR